MADDSVLRDLLARVLSWEDGHVGFDAAVAGLPPDLRGTRPAGLPHSAWELVEHIRIAQRDILEFCGDAEYQEREWPRDYWPATPAPPSGAAWEESLARCREDREALQALAKDTTVALDAPVPHGTTQTYARELLLVADHTAYHVGQLVLVRRLLEAWK